MVEPGRRGGVHAHRLRATRGLAWARPLPHEDPAEGVRQHRGCFRRPAGHPRVLLHRHRFRDPRHSRRADHVLRRFRLARVQLHAGQAARRALVRRLVPRQGAVVEKWRPEADAFAAGLGTTIGSSGDKGYTFSSKVILAYAEPGPLIFLDANSTISRPRSFVGSADNASDAYLPPNASKRLSESAVNRGVSVRSICLVSICIWDWNMSIR
jgi:hypothetical protein